MQTIDYFFLCSVTISAFGIGVLKEYSKYWWYSTTMLTLLLAMTAAYMLSSVYFAIYLAIFVVFFYFGDGISKSKYQFRYVSKRYRIERPPIIK